MINFVLPWLLVAPQLELGLASGPQRLMEAVLRLQPQNSLSMQLMERVNKLEARVVCCHCETYESGLEFETSWAIELGPGRGLKRMSNDRLGAVKSSPSPALAMISQSSPRASIRSRYDVLARSKAETASYSFFFSMSFNEAAAEELA